jgi:putative Holliday junction resolvase
VTAVAIDEFAALLSPRARLLGFDVGSKTIGLAVSDSGLTVASPIETIARTKFTEDAKAIARVVETYKIGGFVLGLPINMDGSEGPRCQSVRQFARNLLEKIDLPLTFWDERLSTSAVDRSMLEADLTRKRRDELVDKLAAAFILQGALDFLRRRAETGQPPTHSH